MTKIKGRAEKSGGVQRVRVSAPVRPTEDADKVRRALLHVFPDLRIDASEDGLRGTTESVDRLRDLIRNRKIRDTARGVLLRGREGDRTRFELNKQAAFAGRVSFAAGSPLGDISVEIESERLEDLIDFVAESTTARKATPSDRTGRT
ncbi:MAG: RNA-binding domain-containing protein [Methanobacteriota archaeon]